MSKTAAGCAFLPVLLWLLWIAGEIMCVVKFVECDFKAPYKAEIVYGVGFLTGTGFIIGWLNIDDTPEVPVKTVAPATK